MKHPTVPSMLATPLACALLLVSACSTAGTAAGQLVEPGGKHEYVNFIWKSDAGASDKGSIEVVLPDGSAYKGVYREVIRNYDADFYAPLFAGWEPYWGHWNAPWRNGVYVADGDTWVTVYTNRVVARLEGQNAAQNMRCRFTLDRPRDGMAGGGVGDCQLSNGEAVHDAVLQRM